LTTTPPQEWVVIVEATADPAFEFHHVKQLVTRLDRWHSSGLYSLERYAVQVQVSSPTHHEALSLALAAHDEAIEALGFAPPTLLRSEVLTLGELKHSVGQTAAEAPVGRVFDALIPTALYEATRALFRANSRAGIDQVLTRFVIAAGGTVNIGELQYFAGQVSVDLALAPGDRMFATADAASMAGLTVEQSLPALIHDAERMLAMLQLADQPHLGQQTA
jgi:hypothetical protein